MKFLKELADNSRDFFNSILNYPVELILCSLCYMLCVLDGEALYVEARGYFLEEVAPVIFMYMPAAFAVAFAIRMGWLSRCKSKISTICYYGCVVLPFIPCFFFDASDFDKSYWFNPLSLTGTYLLVALLLFSVRWQKDNRLFVADSSNYTSSFCMAALFCGFLALLYYALIGSVFYLLLDSYMNPDFFLSRVCFVHIGCFIGVVIAPMLWCYLAVRGEAKKTKVFDKGTDFFMGCMLTPALLCYTVILYLYAVKILFTWNLPKGGLAWMVIAFLFVAFYVNTLRPFAQKERFGWFFKYLPLLSVIPLVMYWISICRRISDYGFTQPRVFLLTFGVLITLFMAFMLVERLNKYLLMACISAVPIFFLTMIPPTSARQIAVNSQQHVLDEFLAKYPIFDVKNSKFVNDIPKNCLKDSVAVKRFASAYEYLEREHVINWVDLPDEISNVVYNYSPDSPQLSDYSLNEVVDLSEYPYYLGKFYESDFPIVDTCGVTLVDSIDCTKVNETVKANLYDDNGTKKIKGVSPFIQKNDKILTLWEQLYYVDSTFASPNYPVRLYGKKPYKVR